VVAGSHPAGHVICASYGQDLADKLARDCRLVMLSPWYQRLFRTRLAGRQAVHDFATTAHGTRLATSVGGVLTGRGADLILLDDPLKPDEALSETCRKAVNDWYDGYSKGSSELQAIEGAGSFATAGGSIDRGNKQDDGLAETFSPRVLCRRRAQAPRAKAQLGESG
jgi:hypothetical protein